MAIVVLPYPNFQPNTTIASAQVNADFAAILAQVNGNLDASNIASISGGSQYSQTGYIKFIGGLVLQWGLQTGVAFDGAAASAVAFPFTFPNACFGVLTQPNNGYQANPWALGSAPTSNTTTGFNVNVWGAPASTTGNVFWVAVGN